MSEWFGRLKIINTELQWFCWCTSVLATDFEKITQFGKKLRTFIFFLSALNGTKLTHFDKLIFKVCYEGKSICLIIETLDALWKICINHKFWEGTLHLIFPSQTYSTCIQQTRINVKGRKRGYKIISFCCKSNTVILKKWDGQTKVSPMIC